MPADDGRLSTKTLAAPIAGAAAAPSSQMEPEHFHGRRRPRHMRQATGGHHRRRL